MDDQAVDKSIFKFKKFEVDQKGCAMKINTDGVLLAALAEARDPGDILDIGTGTGVIALMLAQRFRHAHIEAVEVDASAAMTAERNFRGSIFSNRLWVNHIDINAYQTGKAFDLIVSNPPYFVNDLKNTEEKKGLARHTNMVFFQRLVAKVSSLLSTKGVFWFILPVKQAELMVQYAEKYRLRMIRQISLHSDQTKPEFRRIVCLSKDGILKIEHFYIYESEKVHSLAYRNLLKDFFLRLD